MVTRDSLGGRVWIPSPGAVTLPRATREDVRSLGSDLSLGQGVLPLAADATRAGGCFVCGLRCRCRDERVDLANAVELLARERHGRIREREEGCDRVDEWEIGVLCGYSVV